LQPVTITQAPISPQRIVELLDDAALGRTRQKKPDIAALEGTRELSHNVRAARSVKQEMSTYQPDASRQSV